MKIHKERCGALLSDSYALKSNVEALKQKKMH